jgi:hypothetical protein
MDERDRFLQWNRERLEAQYLLATAKGELDPLVIGLDLRSPDAKQLAIALSSEEEVAAVIDNWDDDHRAPAAFSWIGRESASQMLAPISPGVAKILAQPRPAGAVRYFISTIDGQRAGIILVPA